MRSACAIGLENALGIVLASCFLTDDEAQTQNNAGAAAAAAATATAAPRARNRRRSGGVSSHTRGAEERQGTGREEEAIVGQMIRNMAASLSEERDVARAVR